MLAGRCFSPCPDAPVVFLAHVGLCSNDRSRGPSRLDELLKMIVTYRIVNAYARIYRHSYILINVCRARRTHHGLTGVRSIKHAKFF